MDRLLRWWESLPATWVDMVIAGAVLTAELVNGFVRIDPDCQVCDVDAVRIVVVVLMSVPLVWRRSYPFAVFLVIGLAAAYNGAVDAPALNLGILIAVYSMSAYGTPATAWGSLPLIVGALTLIHLDRGDLGSEYRLDLTAFIPVWLLGRLAAARLRHIDDLESRAEMAEREREQRQELAAADERSRIARELHDIVAHGMSVMVVHAENARSAVGTNPRAAERSLDVIADTGRSAMAELRRVLGVLRADERDTGLAPQPTLADIPALADLFRRAGLTIELDRQGDESRVPASLAVSAHHIVREALTNVLRHAPAANVLVTIRTDHHELAVEVVDDGPGSLAPEGNGITGIRERVEAHDGRIELGSGPDAGFRVAAVFPLEPGR